MRKKMLVAYVSASGAILLEGKMPNDALAQEELKVWVENL